MIKYIQFNPPTPRHDIHYIFESIFAFIWVDSRCIGRIWAGPHLDILYSAGAGIDLHWCSQYSAGAPLFCVISSEKLHRRIANQTRF